MDKWTNDISSKDFPTIGRGDTSTPKISTKGVTAITTSLSQCSLEEASSIDLDTILSRTWRRLGLISHCMSCASWPKNVSWLSKPLPRLLPLQNPSHQSGKTSPKFYGQYEVLQRIGEVAYKLALPPIAKIYLVFHVSCLKKVIGNNFRIQTSLPELDEEGSIWLQPEHVLDTHEWHLHGCMIKEVLVKWKDTSLEDATCEPTTILQQFPQLQPWGQGYSYGGGNVRVPP